MIVQSKFRFILENAIALGYSKEDLFNAGKVPTGGTVVTIASCFSDCNSVEY